MSFNSCKNKGNEINNKKQSTCFEWGSEDYYITDPPKPENLENKFLWNTEKPKTCACK